MDSSIIATESCSASGSSRAFAIAFSSSLVMSGIPTLCNFITRGRSGLCARSHHRLQFDIGGFAMSVVARCSAVPFHFDLAIGLGHGAKFFCVLAGNALANPPCRAIRSGSEQSLTLFGQQPIAFGKIGVALLELW